MYAVQNHPAFLYLSAYYFQCQRYDRGQKSPVRSVRAKRNPDYVLHEWPPLLQVQVQC